MKRIVVTFLFWFLSVTGSFAITPIPCINPDIDPPPNYIGGYFIVTDTNPATQVYSASQAIMVADSDAGFVTWQSSGNCVYTQATLAGMYATINSAAQVNYPAQPTYFASTSAVNVTLTNPLGVAQIVMSTSGKSVILPNMGLYNSPPIGKSFRIINAGATNSFGILDNATNTIVSSLPPQTYVDITVATFGGPSFSASWTYTSSYGAGGATVGTVPAAVQIGGTGLTTLGGIPWSLVGVGATATGPMNIIPAGNTNQVLQGSTGGPPSFGSMVLASAYFANQGTTTTLLHGNAAGNPSFGPVSLTAEVVNTLPAGNGGTGVTTVSGEQARLSVGFLVATLSSANFNTTTDQAITISLPTGFTRYRLQTVLVDNPSISMTTAVGGVYTSASKGGVAVVAASQAWSGLTNNTPGTNGSLVSPTITNASTAFYNSGTLFLSLTTPQGATATADISVFYQPLP